MANAPVEPCVLDSAALRVECGAQFLALFATQSPSRLAQFVVARVAALRSCRLGISVPSAPLPLLDVPSLLRRAPRRGARPLGAAFGLHDATLGPRPLRYGSMTAHVLPAGPPLLLMRLQAGFGAVAADRLGALAMNLSWRRVGTRLHGTTRGRAGMWTLAVLNTLRCSEAGADQRQPGGDGNDNLSHLSLSDAKLAWLGNAQPNRGVPRRVAPRE
jgi:hypothetical protein